MKLFCHDGIEREFISLFDLYVQKGFDPALLFKDDGLLSMTNPPDLSFFDLIKLSKLGVVSDAHLMHYSWLHSKINPISIAEDKVLDGYKWIALSPAFKWESQDQLFGVKLGVFTFLMRCASKMVNFFLLNHDKRKMYESLIFAPKDTEFQWATGYEYIGIQYDINYFKQKMIILNANTDAQEKYIFLHTSILGWSMRVFVAK